tara:strand:- start:955 stop:1131 length:177 start_codon:yes stop_codon:yes gene_type:complete
MKNKNFQITMNEQQIATIMKAGKIIGDKEGRELSRSEAIRLLSYQKAVEIIKEEKRED